MKIRLGEIPEEGRNYTFDRQTGELNSTLEDVVGSHPYAVDMYIKPIGNAYEMRGTVKTTLSEVCSKCGYDFELPIDRKFNEIIFEDETEYRKTHGVHGNQSVNFSDEGTSMIPVRGNVFDAGNYMHEAIVLAEPFYPTCGINGTCLHAEEVEQVLQQLEQQAAEAVAEVTEKTNPFAALKELELPRKN
jgi:uncharacterized protein